MRVIIRGYGGASRIGSMPQIQPTVRSRPMDRFVPSGSFAVQKLTVPDFPLTTELVLTLPAE